MPSVPPVLYPGVYVQEVSSGSHSIVGVPTSVTAFVGRAPRGPVHTPTLVTSFAQYQNQFGGLDADSSVSFAVHDFFNAGGREALIVRTFAAPASAEGESKDGVARISMPGEGTAEGESITLKAASPGSWANDLRVEVDRNGLTDQLVQSFGLSTEADVFNLTVVCPVSPGTEMSERFEAVSLAEDSGGRRLDRVLERGSGLVAFDVGAWGTTLADGTKATVTKDAKGADSAPLTTALDYAPAMACLTDADVLNLLCIPPDDRVGDTPPRVYAEAARWAEEHRAFLIVDPPAQWLVEAKAGHLDTLDPAALGLAEAGRFAAVYFPRVRARNPLREGAVETFPGCGRIAGLMAATDASQGVWKAPAGVGAAIPGITDLELELTDEQNSELNPKGINCLRSFPTYGPVVWGARTLRGADVLDDAFKYIHVRRLASLIELSLSRGMKWAVFEPNDASLWSQLRLSAESFMSDLFRQGAFVGASAKEGYFVQCDASTTTESDIDKGVVNVRVGFAPLAPAEFVVIDLQQVAGPTS